MSLPRWWKSFRRHLNQPVSTGSARCRQRHRSSARISVEALEDRCTPSTFTLLADINQASFDAFPREMVTFQGNVFFRATDGIHGQALWKTDGTAAGTSLVADPFAPPEVPGYDSITQLTVCGNQLFFVADDGPHGPELWVSDGTGAGTHMVADLEDGQAGSNPSRLAGGLGNSVVFFLYTP